MKTHRVLLSVLGIGIVGLGARVASAGVWGGFVNNGQLGSCSSPSGFVDDANDSFLTNYSLWMAHTSGHNDQIRGQATDTNGTFFCTSGFFGDGQSVEQDCTAPVIQYRCQTNRIN